MHPNKILSALAVAGLSSKIVVDGFQLSPNPPPITSFVPVRASKPNARCIKTLYPSLGSSSSWSCLSASTTANEYDVEISEAKAILNRAAETKAEDPDQVLEALQNLEKLMRQKCKAEPDTAPLELLTNLTGSWRLIFTTGTQETQKKFKTKINYFPLKAVQSFDSTVNPMRIENGIYAGDFALLKFFGTFEFDLRKRKLEFDFDEIAIFGFKIKLGRGDAAKIGASSGLGSESNVENAKRDRKAFFNWISADENIAAARGGGGGLALWKRVKE